MWQMKSSCERQLSCPNNNGTLIYDPGWVYWDDCVKKTVAYCNKIGWMVDFGNHADECFFTNPDRTIRISSRRKKENQLYYLLHELGHVLFYLDQRDFGVVTLGAKKTNNSKSKRVATVVEEMIAWKMGLELVPALGFMINRENCDKVMVECLQSYFEWAGRKA